MRYRPIKKMEKTAQKVIPKPLPPQKPPQMDNPYTRYFTQPRTLENLREKWH